jgi:hypothetical protein
MSYLSRVLKKQRRIIRNLENAPIIAVNGFGNLENLVFQVYYYHYSELEMLQDHLNIQSEISENKYNDIQEFDGYHTSDIEFSHFYCGKKIKRYHSETRKQLIGLGKVWRDRVEKKFPNSKLEIVVHFEKENQAWFLDTFNWEIKPDWEQKKISAIWL